MDSIPLNSAVMNRLEPALNSTRKQAASFSLAGRKPAGYTGIRTSSRDSELKETCFRPPANSVSVVVISMKSRKMKVKMHLLQKGQGQLKKNGALNHGV